MIYTVTTNPNIDYYMDLRAPLRVGGANEALAALAGQLSVPVIASGGAGCKEHFRDVFLQGKADAALAASVFHFGEIKIPELKSYLCGEGITIR